jgi:hypothetical protein
MNWAVMIIMNSQTALRLPRSVTGTRSSNRYYMGGLCRFLGRGKFVWMGPGVYIRSGYSTHPGYVSVVELGSSKNHHLDVRAARVPETVNRRLFVYAAREPETAVKVMAVTCDFVVILLTTNREDEAYIVYHTFSKRAKTIFEN